MIPIYIGYDSREKESLFVLAYSILKYATQPISIIPIKQDLFSSFYYRERHPLQSTEFSFTRFLVPYLQHYKDWAIYMDCDMLCQDDIVKLWGMRNDDYDVMIVPHNYIPLDPIKMVDQIQTKYEKKNWSSMMLFNCSKCEILTPEIVQNIDGLYLHQFKWTNDESIGHIPNNWNFLVEFDEYKGELPLGLIHYTTGGPWYKQYKNVIYADKWFAIRNELKT